MSAVDNYNRFIASRGAGYDAAGRLNFNNPIDPYANDPRTFAKEAATLKDLELAAFQAQPAEMRIRQLMDQLEQQRIAMGMGPGTIRMATQQLAAGDGNQSLTYSPTYGK